MRIEERGNKKADLRRLFYRRKLKLTWRLEQRQRLVQLERQKQRQQQEQLGQRQQLVLQEQLVLRQQQEQQEQLALQQLFRHKQSKQEPTEQQQERIISWSVSLSLLIK